MLLALRSWSLRGSLIGKSEGHGSMLSFWLEFALGLPVPTARFPASVFSLGSQARIHNLLLRALFSCSQFGRVFGFPGQSQVVAISSKEEQHTGRIPQHRAHAWTCIVEPEFIPGHLGSGYPEFA